VITFEQYYEELLKREEVPFTPLVAQWPDADVQAIAQDFTQAVVSGGIRGSAVPIRAGSTNQSAGNQVEKFFVERISRELRQFSISAYPGKGYPDRQLHHRSSSRRFALEIKATSQWNPSDTNRRVLTCSSTRLRENFSAPIHHLLTTVCYNSDDGDCHIASVRLDFIQPSTEVGVRLEAEVSHRILSLGGHPSQTI
jgi:hypothetical protein